MTILTTYSVGQKVKINDTVYVKITVDSSSFDNELNHTKNYDIGVYFSGFFYNEVIEIKKGYRQIFYDIVSTWDQNDLRTYEANRRFFLKIRRRHKYNNLTITYDTLTLKVPFKYGYAILDIQINGGYDDYGKSITIFNFHYSNKLPVRI
jgi:hypothetical protein